MLLKIRRDTHVSYSTSTRERRGSVNFHESEIIDNKVAGSQLRGLAHMTLFETSEMGVPLNMCKLYIPSS